MLVAAGQGRGPLRGKSEGGRNAGTAGIVMQSVLITVMVMALSLLAIISRVSSSREGATASSLAAAARQAAEFGFSEVVAEMNRDSKSYLWVTPYASWNSIRQADLSACGIFAASAPAADPIPGASSHSTTTSRTLPNSADLSYQLSDFRPPASLAAATPCGVFGNRKGGTATLTVIGTARRASGDVSTYTLRRSVSVGQALPVFRTSLFAASASTPTAALDPRFSHFPTPQRLGVTPPATWPDLTCAPGGGGGAGAFSCDSAGSSDSFDNASAFRFPYTSSGALASFCANGLDAAGSTQVVCMVGSLTVNNPIDLIVDVRTAPVSLFVSGNLTIANNASLCSDSSAAFASSCAGDSSASAASGDWKRLGLFGRAGGSRCDDQVVSLNASSRINLSQAFLWFPTATLSYPTGLTPLPAGLVGWFCSASDPGATASVQSISTDQLSTGLGDPSLALLFYRGYGSQEQPQ